MDAQTGLNERASVALRQQIQQTQKDLGGKLGALEQGVRAVTTHARDVVRERVEAVRDVVDVRRQVARYPFVSVAVALGAGLLIARRRRRRPESRFEEAQAGWMRSLLASQVATLRTALAGRALALVGELLSDRILRPQSGAQKTPPESRL